jgi:hypothetical protein
MKVGSRTRLGMQMRITRRIKTRMKMRIKTRMRMKTEMRLADTTVQMRNVPYCAAYTAQALSEANSQSRSMLQTQSNCGVQSAEFRIKIVPQLTVK